MHSNPSFYRSDTMKSYKFVMPRQTAWQVMNKLGQVSLMHVVKTKTPILSKPFMHQVKRCEDSLLKVERLQCALRESKIYQPKSCFPETAYKGLFNIYSKQEKKGFHSASLIQDIQKQVDESWEQFRHVNKRVDHLREKADFYRQNLAVIRAGQKNFKRNFFNTSDLQQQFNQGSNMDTQMVHFKCGVIREEDKLKFERLVFRVTRGNSIVTFDDFASIFQEITESQSRKNVFFVLFPTFQKAYFEKKLNKLVETYCQTKYDIPKHLNQFDQKLKELKNKHEQSETVLSLTQEKLNDFLSQLSQDSQHSEFTKLQYLKLYLIKQREIYSQMNQMAIYRNFLIGEVFVRAQDVETLQGVLSSMQKELRVPAGQLVISKTDKLPTNFVINDYTGSVQEIVETYGVARYKEANPAFFTTITFPFLFGVMFGDIAHGILLLFFGIYLIFTHGSKPSALSVIMPHRYLLTLMGFFATYCGFIYNEFLSIALNLFGSCYQVEQNQIAGESFQRISSECVYPFGLDPVWYISQNNLNYVNSLKMKIAVIIGVVHMTLGIFIKASNAVYFKKKLDFIFQFVPQLLFMVLLFGYMDFLIIYKWSKNWGFDSHSAPSIITTMINMPLKLGKTDHCCGGQPMWGEYGNTSQDNIQIIFLLIGILCIPLMLLPKPIYQIFIKTSKEKKGNQDEFFQIKSLKQLPNSTQLRSNSKIQRIMGSYKSIPLKHKESFDAKFNIGQFYEQLVYEFQQQRNAGKAKGYYDKQFQMEQESDQHNDASEIFVHQMIETIEFVLGCISNTASYLRLWALSLAHSQLAEVFLNKTVESSLIQGYWGIPMMVLFFPVFAGATFGVLLCMDSMQCFLHTLRLHWVEFQNKFYKGNGIAFKAFSFQGEMAILLQRTS